MARSRGIEDAQDPFQNGELLRAVQDYAGDANLDCSQDPRRSIDDYLSALR
jgi:hypothetical protein